MTDTLPPLAPSLLHAEMTVEDETIFNELDLLLECLHDPDEPIVQRERERLYAIVKEWDHWNRRTPVATLNSEKPEPSRREWYQKGYAAALDSAEIRKRAERAARAVRDAVNNGVFDIGAYMDEDEADNAALASVTELISRAFSGEEGK